MIFFIDGFLIAVFLGFAVAIGYHLLSAVTGAVSVLIAILAVIFYVGTIVAGIYFLYHHIKGREYKSKGQVLFNVVMSLLSSVLAMYMTHICVFPFIAIEINGVLDLLCSIFAAGFYLCFWLAILCGWLRAQFNDNEDFSILGFLWEVVACVGTYWVFGLMKLI